MRPQSASRSGLSPRPRGEAGWGATKATSFPTPRNPSSRKDVQGKVPTAADHLRSSHEIKPRRAALRHLRTNWRVALLMITIAAITTATSSVLFIFLLATRDYVGWQERATVMQMRSIGLSWEVGTPAIMSQSPYARHLDFRQQLIQERPRYASVDLVRSGWPATVFWRIRLHGEDLGAPPVIAPEWTFQGGLLQEPATYRVNWAGLVINMVVFVTLQLSALYAFRLAKRTCFHVRARRSLKRRLCPVCRYPLDGDFELCPECGHRPVFNRRTA